MPLLERTAGPPLYSQVEERLLERIRRDFRPRQLLPNHRELAAEFGTSLITIKRALPDLARKGFLERPRGRATVVVRPRGQDDLRASSTWADKLTGLGRQPRTAS